MFHWISSYFVSIWDTIFGSLLFTLSSSQQSGRLLVLGLDNAGKTTLLQAIRIQSSSGGSSNTDNTNMNIQQQQQQQQQQQIRSYPPTDRPEYIKNIVTINHQISFNAYDLGGHEAVRHLWSDYYHDTNNDTDTTGDGSTTTTTNTNTNLAILFCIDIADRGRLEEAAYELDALIYDGLLGGDSNNANNNGDMNNGSGGNQQNQHQQSQQSQSTKDGIPIAILLTKCDQMHETTIVSLMTIDEVCNGIEYNKLHNDYNGPIEIFCISVYEQKGYIEALQWITKVLIEQQQQKKK